MSRVNMTPGDVDGFEFDDFPGGWNDADWNFDNYDNDTLDFELWNALQDNPTNEPSSSATFHTASSPPAPPRLSPGSPRLHAPSSRVNGDMTQDRQSHGTARPSSSTNPATIQYPAARSPRPAYSQHRVGSHSRRRRPSTPPDIHAASAELERDVVELGEHLRGFQDRLSHLSNTLADSGRRLERLEAQGDRTSVAPRAPSTITQPSNQRRVAASPTPSPEPSSDYGSFDDPIDIDDILTGYSSASESGDMPPNTRRRSGANGVVDLTNDSSPAPPSEARGRKRSAAGSIRGEASKRRKSTVKSEENYHAQIEQLDLTNEAPDADEELTAALIAQQSNQEDTGKSLKIGQRQCIICMEPFTNITITACGHIYCHECLTQALLAGEKNSDSGRGNCPVCRKQVNRKVKNQVIPLSFMKKSAFKGKAKRLLG